MANLAARGVLESSQQAAWQSAQPPAHDSRGSSAAPPLACADPPRPQDAEGRERATSSKLYRGRVKSFSHFSGFGFIECEALFEKYRRDVFVHHTCVNGCRVGSEVEFLVFFNAKGQPQAKELREVCPAGGARGDRGCCLALRREVGVDIIDVHPAVDSRLAEPGDLSLHAHEAALDLGVVLAVTIELVGQAAELVAA
uniref:CSD domain-containing protein n=1 Tax=Zooxanthella nutricula TaxID=1333877 RepID=A0A7S2P522_9DINO